MVLLFFQNTALIVSFTCAFNVLNDYYSLKHINYRTNKLLISIAASILTIAMMFHPYIHEGMRFDLRSVPVFFISFIFGWKYAVITSFVPVAIRMYIGGIGTLNGILSGFIIPIIIGVLYPLVFKNKKSEPHIIDLRGLVISNLIFSLARAILFKLQLSLPHSKWIWLNITLTAFSLLALICIGQMLNHSTRRLMAEKESRVNEERYEQLIALLPDGLSIICEDKYIYANKHLADILGFASADDLIGRSVSECYVNHPDYVDIVTGRLKKLHKLGRVPFLEQKIILKDGRVADVEISAAIFYKDDKSYKLSITRDLSDQKKADLANKMLRETIEIDKLRTEFFSNMSHELKTPLNIILGTVQLADLLNKNNPPYNNFNKHIKIMKQNCFRLLRLVNNFIDITRLEAGYLSMNIQNLDIVKLVEDITLSVAKYIEHKNVTVTFDTEIEELGIACDPDKMERIILNLLSNSIKFTQPEDEINVYIYIESNRVNISVKDTGIGIPEDKLPIIFERFRQVDSSLQRRAEGSGIGLSLVKSLAEAQGGYIAVKSQEGIGSEFIVTLPVRLIEEDETALRGIAATSDTNIERIHIEFSDIYS